MLVSVVYLLMNVLCVNEFGKVDMLCSYDVCMSGVRFL